MKFTRALLCTVLFTLLLVAIYYLHMRFFRVDVVFYAAIFDGVLAAALTGLLLWFLPQFGLFSSFEKFQMVMFWLVCGYAFAISGPAVIDRSLSFYILEKLQQRGGGIAQNRIKQVFVEEYLPEHRLVDVRLTEQLESGTIEIRNDCVMLTEKGQRIANFGRYFRANWLPKQRLLMGEYSADLTNPFRNSQNSFDYTCDGK